MNDQFLHRLREQPPRGFAARLKSKLDRQAATMAVRKRFFSLISVLVIGGTALAFASPSIRRLVGSAFDGPDVASVERREAVNPVPTPSSGTLARVAAHSETEIDASQIANSNRSVALTPPLPAFEVTSHAAESEPASSGANSANNFGTVTTQTPIDLGIAALPPGGKIRIDGASSTFAIVEAVADGFQTLTKQKVSVLTGISGTVGGLKKFCHGDVDIVGVARPILKPEMEACAAANIKFIELPIAYDALVVVANNNATWVSEIKIAELKKIWEPAARGRLLRWKDINPVWPDQFLQLYGPYVDSPQFDFFSEAVIGTAKALRNDYTGSEFSELLTQYVSQNQSALGFMSYGHYQTYATQMKVLKIINSAGQAVSPRDSTIIDGSYSPLVRPLLIYVNAERAKRPEVRAFVGFFFTKGVKLIREVNDIPLSAVTYQAALDRFMKGRAGTMFDGQSAIGIKMDEAMSRDPEP